MLDALKRIREGLGGSSFFANALTMLSGTAIAQAIPMLMSPVLTRLYSAEDYGGYAVFLLLSYTISALASLRYEFAVMLPEDERDAASIVVLCLGLAIVLSCLAASAVVAIRLSGVRVEHLDRLGSASYLLGPMVLLQSSYQTVGYWLLRKQAFRQLAISRVFRAVTMAGANVAFGLAHVRQGLIVSSLLGQTVALVVVTAPRIRLDWRVFAGVKPSRVREQARLHRHFALYTLPAELLSTLSQQLPLMFFPQKLGGYFAFVQNVVNAPLGFISGAVLDVFKERATRDYRERGEFRTIFVRLLRLLAVLSVVPTALLVFFGPPLFVVVFGEAWRTGGELAQIMAISFCFKFVASPLSYSYFVAGRTKEDFLLHVWIAVSSAAALSYGVVVLNRPLLALWLFTINYAVIYILYLVRSYRFSCGLSATPRRVGW